MGLVIFLEVGLSDAQAQGEANSPALQACADADLDLLYAAVRGRTRLELLLDAEWQRRQNFTCNTTDSLTSITAHSIPVVKAKYNLH